MGNKFIIKKVFEKLMTMSPVELLNKIESHQTTDIAAALHELDSFNVGNEENLKTLELNNKSCNDVALQASSDKSFQAVYSVSLEDLIYSHNFRIDISSNDLYGFALNTETIPAINSEKNLDLLKNSIVDQISDTWTAAENKKWAA